MAVEEVPPPLRLLDQDFSKLEESLEAGVWEVDGDSLCLYASSKDEDSTHELPGAVLVTEGSVESMAELVHRIRSGEGAQVTRLSVDLVCESMDIDSNGIFTVGLAFDDDFEEAALLAVTIRRTRPETKGPREPGDPPEPPEQPKPVGVQMNGEVILEDVGELPARIFLDVELHWGKERRAILRHRLGKESEGVSMPASTGFYTTNVTFDVAKALFMRATGAVRIRLVSLCCISDGSCFGTT
eukprot:TRINITY_DN102657_c0_g1_i1.p1 TRINITY_DN102657_c0_g1~~TRINITY_DN102657_c0_g1_i1.p1  ORF type:complete len:242 (-),score=33.31 TRINITY_DN102657_c0_g1_i1:300-1025(-)